MLEIIASIIIGFCASVFAWIVYDSFSYGEIFGDIKLWLARFTHPELVDEFIINSKTKSGTVNKSFAIELYDYVSQKNKLVALLNCEYCLSIWVSIIFCIVAVFSFDLNVNIVFPFSISLAYYLVDKVR